VAESNAQRPAGITIVTRGCLQPGMKVGVIGLGGLAEIGARVGIVKGAEVHVAEPAWPLPGTL
jgi:propanol-preferring alcohol dehydrogenase